MRIAVLSDIHGNLPALQAVVADLARRKVDRTLNLGDHLSGPLMAAATAEFLMRQPWAHIAGNHDRALARADRERLGLSDAHARLELGEEALRWVAGLPASLALEGGLLLIHGTPARDDACLLETIAGGLPRLSTPEEIALRLKGTEAQVVLCGHSHLPRSVRTAAGGWVVNPGSVGLQAYEHDDPEYHIVQTGSPDARYAVIEANDGGWTVELISVPYDTRPVVDLARDAGRPDWATALESGTFTPQSSLLRPLRPFAAS